MAIGEEPHGLGAGEDLEISQSLGFVLRSRFGSFELAEGESLIGRSRNCQVVVKDPSVSRSHALLTLHGGVLRVKDLASSNGTYVNGKRVRNETALAAGDRLTLGETHLDLEALYAEGSDEEDFSFAGLIAEVEAAGAGSSLADLDTIHETLQTALEPAADPEELEAEGEKESTGASLAVVEAEIVFEDEVTPSQRFAPPEAAPSPPPPEAAPAPPPPEAAPSPPPAGSMGGPPSPPEGSSLPTPQPPESLLASDTVQEAMRRLAPEPSLPELEVPAPPEAARDSASPGPPETGEEELLPSLDELDQLIAAPSLSGSGPSAPGVGRAEPASRSAQGRSLGSLDRVPRVHKPQIVGAPVGLGARLGAGLLDALLVAALAFLASLAGGGPWQPEGGAIFYTALFGIALLIQVFGLNLWGTTPGKRLLGLYVFDEAGEGTLSVGRALARFGGYLLSGLSLGFGFLMILFTSSRRGLHDVLAGTYVGRKE